MIGKEVSYINSSVGKLGFCTLNEDVIIIEDKYGNTKIWNRNDYELLLLRIEKINKLLTKKLI